MDPIRTAVKYSLIPLRTIVQIGEAFVAEEPEFPPQPQPTTTPRAQKRTQPRKAQRARKAAGPQASQTPKDLDDVAIARKVESVIFRDERVQKGKIDVNAAEGVVWLRGEARNPELIKEIERHAAAIPEVRRVENLLHLPKTPAPTRADTPRAQQRTRSSTKRPAPHKVETGVTNERRSARGENLPVESAHEGEGREPAPLGSDGNAS
jgi:hypothetical protein